MAQLDGKTAWITGGGSGIGAAAARSLAEAGADIVVSGRRSEPLETIAEEIRSSGGKARTLVLDVSDAVAVRNAVDAIGPVDILVASAGLNVPGRAMDRISDEDWSYVVDINLNGVFHTARAVLPGMRQKGDGLLILISSWAGRYASRLTGAAYNATKRAVIALSESINEEEGAHGIRSTVVMPGEVVTDILKSRPVPPSAEEQARMLKAEDLGATIRFLAELPSRACINELLISPTWNRFYQGFDEA
ncbi:SDR family NAD(P)-dependent oxidoreductase [Alisedimentitalea sp. MJ-SS2]|uniref:SDR family oxidoreductase n=1 Tax=Aliisedimentitalea sp. MJ-SS2 TaxID=3049795 RepID=UPI002912229B|nr:SDR family NAD(P)-dependent oxidoreductase [Alisedimentitalea sp. MJ-SS2]MDU8928011.1 SDR family NAD(P)-dependent oxidoreductase [Alisedimentitalea sp. MJ-SS2]